ncbi:MAG: hypothetical protein HN348_30785, partial [Proteobacteria bacterium]|nr:hypothetical protein [Pseudomonadota bacterium]
IGGGIYASTYVGDNWLTLRRVVVDSNDSNTDAGGLYLQGTLDVDDLDVLNNSGTDFAAIEGSQLGGTWVDVEIAGNTGSYWEVAYLPTQDSTGAFSLSDVLVTDNQSTINVLAIVSGGQTNLANIIVSDNTGNTALFLDGDVDLEVVNVIVAGNSSNGVEVQQSQTTALLRNATIVGNGALGLTASVYGDSSFEQGFAIVNAIIFDNDGGGVKNVTSNWELDVTYSDVFDNGGLGNWSGFSGDPASNTGNISVDPLFVDYDVSWDPSVQNPSTWDLHLQSGSSQCEGAGENSDDMGAYGGPNGTW